MNVIMVIEKQTESKDDDTEDLLARFLRYVRIATASDRFSHEKPSTPGQWDLLGLLREELGEMGFRDSYTDKNGYVIVRIPSNRSTELPTLALIAHVDTSPDAPGQGVKPLVHRNYQGQVLDLKGGLRLDPASNPHLLDHRGNAVITSDGGTLLGADNKAGIAEIMALARFLAQTPDHPRGPLELIFTSDEEIGRGVESWPTEQVKAQFAYTVDGGRAGVVEAECYHALQADVTFKGVSYHPGYARGKMVNSLSMAAAFVGNLPRSESPEATDGRYGCLWPSHLEGGVEECRLQVHIRDFQKEECERRWKLLESLAKSLELAFPGGQVLLERQDLYSNMADFIGPDHPVLTQLERAAQVAGISLVYESIRGGTDGARLTEMGLPCPNIFTGGMNFHSRLEWIGLESMVQTVSLLKALVRTWAQVDPGDPA